MPNPDRYLLELRGRGVDVWAVRIVAPANIVARFNRILAPDEASRAEQFQFEHLRRSFVLSRGLLRTLLGGYLGLPARDVQFSYGSKGKPSLVSPVDLEFSASHSGALALFAFTLGCALGVDVEQIRPLQDIQEVANRYFCPEEAGELMSIPANERERAFLLCWTRKEAYIKAVGEGLSTPLNAFRVTLRPSEPPRLIHVAHNTATALGWTLHDLEPDPQYSAALAYRDSPRPIRTFPPLVPAELCELIPD